MFYPHTVEQVCERFWARVDTSGECWIWTGGLNRVGGYGRMSIDGVNIPAHRIAWGYAHGMPPDDLELLHRCDTPRCVRHHHLFLGTHMDNMHDAAVKGRMKGQRFYGEKHPAARFTIEEVRSIIQRRKSGEPLASIAESFGVWPSTICKIARGDRWAVALREEDKC